MRSFGLWLALVGGIAGCKNGDGLIVVSVSSTVPVTGISTLSAAVTVGGQTRNFPVPTGGSFDVPPAKTFGVAVPHGISGPCSVHVDAFDGGGALIGSGDGDATISAGGRAGVTIDLSGGVVGGDGGADFAGGCAGDSVDACGASCTPCTTAPANGTPACVAGMCSFACDANYVAQANMCVACGALDQPCCAGSACGAGLFCNAGGVCKVPWSTVANIGTVYGLYGTGPNDIWLGDFGGFIWHSTGGAFVKNPTTAIGSHITSMWASGVNDIWASGYNAAGASTIWNNKAPPDGTWNVVSGTPAGSTFLWGTSATDIYVGGGTGNAGSATAIIWHYPGSGSTFTVQLTTTSSGYGIQAIWGASVTAIWAVSGPRIFAYNGAGAWNDVTPAGVPASTYFWSIGGSGANDVYAGAGNYLLHWNGSAWSQVTLPASFSGLTFYGLWGSKPSDIYGAVNGGIVHFDGTTWSQQQIPAAANGSNYQVLWGSGANDVYAAGSSWVLHHP